MSQLDVFYEKLLFINQTYDILEPTCADKNQLSEKFEQSVNLNELSSLAPENLILIIDDFKDSLPEKELKVLENYQSLSAFEKKCILKMMEFAVKMGILDDASDLEKRRHWYTFVSQNQ